MIDFYDINNPRATKLANDINDTISFIETVDNRKSEEAKFSLTNSRGETTDDVTKYTRLRDFGVSIRNGTRTIDEVEEILNDMENDILNLTNRQVRNERKQIKKEVINNVERVYSALDDKIKGFKKGYIFMNTPQEIVEESEEVKKKT